MKIEEQLHDLVGSQVCDLTGCIVGDIIAGQVPYSVMSPTFDPLMGDNRTHIHQRISRSVDGRPDR